MKSKVLKMLFFMVCAMGARINAAGQAASLNDFPAFLSIGNNLESLVLSLNATPKDVKKILVDKHDFDANDTSVLKVGGHTWQDNETLRDVITKKLSGNDDVIITVQEQEQIKK